MTPDDEETAQSASWVTSKTRFCNYMLNTARTSEAKLLFRSLAEGERVRYTDERSRTEAPAASPLPASHAAGGRQQSRPAQAPMLSGWD
jgi:hypothetical protein